MSSSQSYIPRDSHLREEVAKAQGCKPISDWCRLCVSDVVTLCLVAFSIWYIVWGISLTVRLYKCMRDNYFPRTSTDDENGYISIDLEKDSGKPEGSHDPYLTQSPILRTYLRSKEQPHAPKPTYTPFDYMDAAHHDLTPGSPAVFSSSCLSFDTSVSPVAHSSLPRIVLQRSDSIIGTTASPSNLSEFTLLHYYRSESCSSLAPPLPVLRSPTKTGTSICKPQPATW